MIVLFSSSENLKNSINNFSKSDLAVFGFDKSSPQFLTKEYYILVDKLIKFSFKLNTQFILAFFINKLNKKYLGGVLIERGKIKSFFGECFTKKHLSFKVKNKIVSILFYYDLYSNRGKVVTKFSSLIIGLDDDDVLDDVAFLDNKFFNKLILVGKDIKINCGKLKKNRNKQKNCVNVFYKI